MAHSNRNIRKITKLSKHQQNRARKRSEYEAKRDSGKNTKRSADLRSSKVTGHPHKETCHNIGCLRDSHPARVGYMKLMTRMHGPAFAEKMALKRGWVLTEV